ncbi:YdeI/OmpD-associated family protein [Phytohabitans rumicis]|uniref:DUF1905 domain-containing protein n=1 Tax=Phytohabitans rumicis TaxID=1076125 RepID=A0A6V8LDZ8_9ACTN|nr:YdeI/OmpD-associated family protein [Phytohabitans rumicis]GFJ93870.1 hypothetical protein Prum_075120 [Phytohabitans rumicis]
MKIRAELQATGRTTTGFEVPEALVDALGGGRHPKVAATINGYTFRTSIARMGDGFWLGVSAERRQAAGVQAGDVLDLEVELDTAPREVELPDDLAAALAGDPAAKAFWDTLSRSKQQWHVVQVTAAKKADTRASRVAKSVAMLRDHRAR